MNRQYSKYHSSPRMKQEHAIRNKNRRNAQKRGIVRKGDGLHIDHKDGNVRNNNSRNLRVVRGTVNRRKQ